MDYFRQSSGGRRVGNQPGCGFIEGALSVHTSPSKTHTFQEIPETQVEHQLVDSPDRKTPAKTIS